MKRARLMAFFLFPLPCMGQTVPSHNSCTPEPITTLTRWGGNELVEIDMREHPVRAPHGGVAIGWPEHPADGVLLQVFKRSPSDPPYSKQDQATHPPVAACVTGADGTFSFTLPQGEYELRASMGKGMNVTLVFLTVKRGWHSSRKIVIQMHPGT